MALVSPAGSKEAGSETNVEVEKPSSSSTQDDLKSLASGKEDVVKKSDKKEDGDTSPKKTISYINRLSQFIWKTPVERKPSYCSGVDEWVPIDPEQVVEIPEAHVDNYKRAYPLVGEGLDDDGAFLVICDAEAQKPFPNLRAVAERELLQIMPNLEELSVRFYKQFCYLFQLLFTIILDIIFHFGTMGRLAYTLLYQRFMLLRHGIDFNDPTTSAGPDGDQKLQDDASSDRPASSVQKSDDDRPEECSCTNIQELWQPPKPPLYHLVRIKWDPAADVKKMLSLYRSRRVTDVIALCERCRECEDLFDEIPKGKKYKEYYGEVLSNLKKHVLWKSGHVAASMGLVNYFKKPNHDIRQGVDVPCQPEGMTPLHIAVMNNWIELVTYLLSLDPDLTAVDVNKNNVLHLAAGSSAKMIKVLMESGKCQDLLNVANSDGSTPLYVAVTSANAYCAKKLQHYGASLTSESPKSSKNPIVDAMKKDKLDVDYMRSILEANPKALEEIDAITGNSVLHNAKYKKPLLALLQLKANDFSIETRNSQKQTALHVYVQRNDLPMVMALTAYDADVNAQDGNGSAPLHIAVSNNNLDIVRLLLCLGADPNLRNNQSETPRHLAAKLLKTDDETGLEIIKSLIICEAEPCPKGFPGCTVACVHKDNFVNEPKIEDTPPKKEKKKEKDEDQLSQQSVDPRAPTAMYEFNLDPESQEPKKAYKEPNPIRSFPQEEAIDRVVRAVKKDKKPNVISVLAMDGGGIKGLVTVQILLALEKFLDEPLLNYFDWIAGTSTGSYIAGALCTGTSLRCMQKRYLRFKDALFDTWSRPYSAEILEGFLQEIFGEETALADVDYPKLFFTTVRADQFPVQLDLLRSYTLPITKKENNDLGFEDPKELKIWRAARRSSAAPTYFPSSEGKYIDGGMVANNPTSDLLTEICFWNSVCKYVDPDSPHTVDVGCVLSVGTGITPIVPVDPKLFEMSDMLGLLRGLKNLTSMVLDQATATEGAPIARARTWCHSLGMPYYRLNAPLSKDVMMDSKEETELVKMMWETVVYSFTHRKDFEELASLLKTIGTNKDRRKILPLDS